MITGMGLKISIGILKKTVGGQIVQKMCPNDIWWFIAHNNCFVWPMYCISSLK